jgi:hypothetical protein
MPDVAKEPGASEQTMMFRVTRVAISILFVGLLTSLALLLAGAARAQTPDDPCTGPDVEAVAGGGEVSLGNVTVTLPAGGTFGIGQSLPPGAHGEVRLTVCDLGNHAYVALDSVSGTVVTRDGTSSALDEVIESAILPHGVTPNCVERCPTPLVTPPGGTGISPPSTGSAGLASGLGTSQVGRSSFPLGM